MNPDFEILKTAALVLGCLFAVAGILTLACRSTSWGRNMGIATASWAVICAVFLLAPFAGPVPFALVIIIIAILALREFYGMTRICCSVRLFTSATFGYTDKLG